MQDGSKVYLSNWLLKWSTQSIPWLPISSAVLHNIYVYLYSCHARVFALAANIVLRCHISLHRGRGKLIKFLSYEENSKTQFKSQGKYYAFGSESWKVLSGVAILMYSQHPKRFSQGEQAKLVSPTWVLSYVWGRQTLMENFWKMASSAP